MQPLLALAPTPPRARAVPLRHLVVAQQLGGSDDVARALVDALAEPTATTVLLVAAGATIDPAAVRAALDRVAADDGLDVVAWSVPGDAATCLAVLLPLDAVRAVGLAHAGLTGAALADLALRADAAGFRAVRGDAADVAGRPSPPTARDRVLLAMLHEPRSARGRVVGASLLAEAGALLGGRWAEVAARHRDLAAVLVATDADARTATREGGAARVPGGVLRQALALHAALWLGWRPLRRRVRAAAGASTAQEAWTRRLAGGDGQGDDTRPDGERERARRGPHDVRWRPWSTTRRGTSAA